MTTKKVPEGYLFSKGYTYYVFALLCHYSTLSIWEYFLKNGNVYTESVYNYMIEQYGGSFVKFSYSPSKEEITQLLIDHNNGESF